MKKNIAAAVIVCIVIISCLLGLAACGGGSDKLSGSVTVKEWLDKKGEGDSFTVTVKIVELINPYYARVEDESGSVLLFGLWENGEPKAFAEKDIDVGDTIVVKNPVYNVYEGNVEMKEGVLVEKK